MVVPRPIHKYTTHMKICCKEINAREESLLEGDGCSMDRVEQYLAILEF